jgi:WD40-like Beta Propeller Repeat
MNIWIGGTSFLVLLLASAGPTYAEVTGEVIASDLYYSANTAVMSAANGGQYTEVPCGSDLTHGGSPRYFLGSVATGYYLPDGYEGSELIAADEGCVDPLVITNSPDMRFSTTPHWSPDGTRIAVYGERWDLEGGALLESGVFVMDVVYDGTGRPIGTENSHLVIPVSGETLLSWSGDATSLAYINGASDGAGGTQSDVFVFDLISGLSSNVSNSRGVSEGEPNFSPVDDRIAYTSLVQVRGSFRYDIFTVDAISGGVVQVTSKATTGKPANRFPVFSPDGQYLSFSSGSVLGPIMSFDIYKIKANGSGKAVNLTGKRDGDFRYHVWRK